jgi:hypothetical protein
MPARKTTKASKPASRKAPRKKASTLVGVSNQIYQIKVTLKDFKPFVKIVNFTGAACIRRAV